MKLSQSLQRFCFTAVTLVLVIRLLTLVFVPLSDKTEARYGNIARLMVTSGDWITPQIEPGVPFWAKPPLSTWLSALSFKVFGVHEFAARLPSYLLGIAVLWLTYLLALRKTSRDNALRSALILATTPAFFVSIGTVMTDPALLLGTTLSMTGFGMALSDRNVNRGWGYLFFTGLAVGLLAKGPIAIIMTGVPIFIWTLWQRKWLAIWKQLPWITGTLLMLVISLPWYLIAEQKTPGFLDYFIVGEHWKRFTVSGWEGDLYGGAHSRPKGTIWLYFLLTALPWSFFLIYSLRSTLSRAHIKSIWKKNRLWNSYFLSWAVAPLLFFTMAGNILWTYVLTGIPAFAILISSLFDTRQEDKQQSALTDGDVQTHHQIDKTFSGLVLGIVSLLVLAMVALCVVALMPVTGNYVYSQISQKNLVSEYNSLKTLETEELIYLFTMPCSASFYSGGRACLITDMAALKDFKHEPGLDFFVTRNPERLPESFMTQVDTLGKYGHFYLLREKSSAP